ncbi:MAG: polysaccharide deacetylase family protein [Cytophagales bacterium]|nr:polysaccharide deacetylase family protein [Cytophagales bacterium]
MNLFRTPFFLPWLYPRLTWRVPTSEKKVFLTFDDGPVPGPTTFVLATLQQVKARATFFCIGDNVRKHPRVFNEILQAGHVVGNHTFNHLKGWNTPLQLYLDNIQQCTAAFSQHENWIKPGNQLAGNNIAFRPPYGRITRAQINALQHHYRIVMWDVLTNDYDKSLSPERCLQGTRQATRPGSIVVFHDSYKAEKNLTYVLPRYLDYLQAEGYTFGVL